MAIATTLSALQCVPICDSMRELSDAQFYTWAIDKLATEAGIDLADITSGDLQTISEEVICDLEGRSAFYEVSPMALKALMVYLINEATA